MKLVTFSMSKKESNIQANLAVSDDISPTTRGRALATESLSTCNSIEMDRLRSVGNGYHERTGAARSTLIFEKVSLMCSNFNFGTMAIPVALPLSRS